MLNFQACLTSVPFDKNYNNTIRFSSRTEQETYFDNENLLKNASYINFNVKKFFTTEIVYKSFTADVSKFMNYNYCIIRNNNADVSSLKYYYYFVDEINYISASEINVKLTLDVIQTYYIDISFQDCMFERANINRFKKDSGRYFFDYRITSDLFYPEHSFSLSKYTQDLTVLKGGITIGNYNDYDEYVRNIVDCWIYAFVSPDVTFTNSEYKFAVKDCKLSRYNYDDFSLPYIILCAPVYNADTTKRITINGKEWSFNSLLSIINSFATKTAQIYQLKLMHRPPFRALTNYTFSEEKGLNIVSGFGVQISYFGDLLSVQLISQDLEPIELVSDKDLSTHLYNSFNKDDITDNAKKSEYELDPKQYNDDYSSIEFFDGTNKFVTSPSKFFGTINPSVKIRMYLYEIIDVGITRYFLSVNRNQVDNFYQFDKNFCGLVGSRDTSIPYSVDKLNEFLAQNKNYYIQRGVGSIFSVGNSAMNIGVGATTGNVGAMLSGAGSLLSAINNGINDFILTPDNMQSAPDTLKNSDGATFNDLCINGGCFTIIINRAIDSENKSFIEQRYMYGFSYPRLANVKECDNIRKRFNFVKCKIENISAPYGLSDEVHDELRRIFSRGIRFWNVSENDMFQYKKDGKLLPNPEWSIVNE